VGASGPQRDGGSADGRYTAGILTLTAPLVISFVARASFTWVDTIFAAELDQTEGQGDFARAAITLIAPFEFMMIAVWVGTSNGLTARLSAAMGARDGARIEQLQRATTKIVWGLCAAFLGFAALLWMFPGAVATEGSVRPLQIYGTVMIAGSALVGFWSILPDSIVKAHHDMRSTMWAGLLSGGVNVALNVLFMRVFHWGMFGIAFSTVLGRAAALVYASRRASFHERRRRAAGRDTGTGVYDAPVRAILAIAVPASITFLLMSVESQAVNMILKRGPNPNSSLAAWGLFDQATRFLAMPVIACGVAMLPLAASLWGRGDCAAIRRELRTALGAGLVYVILIVTPLAFLLGDRVAAALSTAEEATAWAALGIRWLPLAVLAMSPLFILRSTFEGLQRPRPGMVVSFIRTAALAVPLTWLGTRVAPTLGRVPIEGAYVGYTLGVGIASGILYLWLRRVLATASTGPSA